MNMQLERPILLWSVICWMLTTSLEHNCIPFQFRTYITFHSNIIPQLFVPNAEVCSLVYPPVLWSYYNISLARSYSF